MQLSTALAKHFRGILFGGNWTDSNYKDQLADVDWQMANAKVKGLNTIAQLAYHATYYLPHVTRVLECGPLEAKDQYSWETPNFGSESEWQAFLEKAWADAEHLAGLIEQLPEDRLGDDFADPKYGHVYSNISGIIEHLHYHLGQIVLLKKLIAPQQD